jgi:hypothetical protein
MQREHDLIVRSPDSSRPLLVAEVKWIGGQSEEAKRQLRSYMIESRCPVGLIVTPSDTWLLRDSYESYEESSIREAAHFPTPDLFDAPLEDERSLLDATRAFLEDLASGSLPTTPARRQLASELMPDVAEGRVTSGSPR